MNALTRSLPTAPESGPTRRSEARRSRAAFGRIGKSQRGSMTRFGILAASIAASVGLLGGGIANATAGRTEAPAQAPAAAQPEAHRGGDVPVNLGKVKLRIETYYGDHVADGEHYASSNSEYGSDVRGVEHVARQYLKTHARKVHGRDPALVFDVDDTTLLTYNYELENDFGYDPVTNNEYIQAEKMRSVFGMPGLLNWAKGRGYTIFFLTGRPESQRDATKGNLHKVGYRTAAGPHRLFLKNTDDPPAYLDCGSHCTTIEYKSQTRKHIESLGFNIVGNFGDQRSDLKGGHADRTYKLPNPMYYLP